MAIDSIAPVAGRVAVTTDWPRGAEAGINVRRVATLTVIGLCVLAWTGALCWYALFYPRSFAYDFDFYAALGQRWLDTGQWYLPGQLAGPYPWHVQVDNMYPPFALPLFVAGAVLPPVLWWVVPLAVLGYALWRWRPSMGALALGLALLSHPKALSAGALGNTDLWLAAFVAAGLLWRWPVVFVLLKPTLAPFALIGIRSRSWWVALALLVLFAVASLPLWLDYVTAMRDVSIDPLYSVLTVPIALAPVVLWWGRTKPARSSWK